MGPKEGEGRGARVHQRWVTFGELCRLAIQCLPQEPNRRCIIGNRTRRKSKIQATALRRVTSQGGRQISKWCWSLVMAEPATFVATYLDPIAMSSRNSLRNPDVLWDRTHVRGSSMSLALMGR
eukprot:SAG11_NODE_15866_length_564_cov_0.776344_2_plen_122_part_01